MAVVLVVLGILAEAIVSLSVGEQYPLVSLVGFACVAIGIIGGLLIIAGQRRAGAIAVIVGSIFFVPLGLIAIFGARKVMDTDNERAFEERRRQTQ